MSKIELDILTYIPLLFITTLLMGLKLDGKGSPASAEWSTVLLPLLISIPWAFLLYAIRHRIFWPSSFSVYPHDKRNHYGQVNGSNDRSIGLSDSMMKYTIDDNDCDDNVDYNITSIDENNTSNNIVYIEKSRKKAMANDIDAHKLIPFVYSRDKMGVTISLAIWSYFTVVPWALSFSGTKSSELKVPYYCLLGLMIVIMLVLLMDNIYWIIPFKYSISSISATNIGGRVSAIFGSLKESVAREVHHLDEEEYIRQSIIIDRDIVNDAASTRFPINSDRLKKREDIELNESRSKDEAFGISIVGSDDPNVHTRIPSGSNDNDDKHTKQGSVDNIPDMETFACDGNLDSGSNNKFINAAKRRGVDVIVDVASTGLDAVMGKRIRSGNDSLPIDKGKQSKIGISVSVLLSLCLLMTGFATDDVYYMKLAFVIPGALFISIIMLVLIQRQFRVVVWCIGLVLTSTSYITIVLMLYNLGHSMGWISAFIPLMVLEWYIALVCYCAL